MKIDDQQQAEDNLSEDLFDLIKKHQKTVGGKDLMRILMSSPFAAISCVLRHIEKEKHDNIIKNALIDFDAWFNYGKQMLLSKEWMD